MKKKHIYPIYFKTYDLAFVYGDGLRVNRKFIVLEHPDGTLQFTNFHRYVRNTRGRVRNMNDDGYTRFSFVVQALNYIFNAYDINCLNDVTIDMIIDFLNRYGTCTLPGDDEFTSRKKSTVERCHTYILDFFKNLIRAEKKKCKLKESDLVKKAWVRDRHGKAREKDVSVFDVRYKEGQEKQMIRDIPSRAFDLFFHQIFMYHQDIMGIVMCSAFGGLRPSEACNVRREDSALGAGIRFYYVGGELIKIKIDIRKELVLRSDLVSVGRIKKERMATIPGIFLKSFEEGYKNYTQYLSTQKYEEDYGPFSVNSKGMAMTYASYADKFRKIMKYEMVPIYLNDADPDVVLFGRIVAENPISPHILRHWFTVQLVLSGVSDPATLMYYRGDTSPESALTYLNNKGELDRTFRKINNEMFDYNLWKAQKQKDV